MRAAGRDIPRAGVAAARPLGLDGGRARSRANLLALSDHGDSGVSHGEAACQVVLAVDADTDPGRNDDVLVDNGSLDRGILADLDEVEQNTVRDGRVAVDVNTGGEHRVGDMATANHDTGGHR